MSKITNVRLPNTISPTYEAGQINQIVRSIEQIVLTLNSTYGSTFDSNTAGAAQWFGAAGGGAGGGFAGGVRGFQTSHGILLPYGMLMSDQDQPSLGVTSENLVSYSLPVLTSGVSIEDNTKIKFTCSGQYLVVFSLMFTNRGNAAQEIEVWAKNSGTNYPLSNTRFDIPARKSSDTWSHLVASVNGIFTVNNPATEFLEIAWWSDGADVFIENYPARTTPDRPAIPSVILTANLISATGGNLV
jgi:hypothetical protein